MGLKIQVVKQHSMDGSLFKCRSFTLLQIKRHWLRKIQMYILLQQWSSGQRPKHIQFRDHVLILAQMQACIIFEHEWDMKGLGIKIKDELQIYIFYYKLHQGYEANLPLTI
jgi:hypothetical protein